MIPFKTCPWCRMNSRRKTDLCRKHLYVSSHLENMENNLKSCEYQYPEIWKETRFCINCGTVTSRREYYEDENQICPVCFRVEKRLLAHHLKEREIKSLEQAREKLISCKFRGTCDILNVHHDILKEDPERLTTEFCIKLTCGDNGLKKYYNRKKVLAEAE